MLAKGKLAVAINIEVNSASNHLNGSTGAIANEVWWDWGDGSALTLQTISQNVLDFRVALITLFYPLGDMIRVMIVRFINNKALILPDSNHLHHIFIKNNFNETSTVFILYGITISTSLLLFTIIS